MKKYLLVLLLTASPLLSAETLTLKFTHMDSWNGKMAISVFKGPKGFPSKFEYSVMSEFFEFIDNQIQIELPAGTYAISLFHDENNNRDFDLNPVGIPTESFGFSNNPKISFGPPKYKKAAFQLNSDKTLTIKMKRFFKF